MNSSKGTTDAANKIWTYGNSTKPFDDGAMKAASAELKGLTAYFLAGIQEYHFPLTATIDYLGHRVFVTSGPPPKCSAFKASESSSSKDVFVFVSFSSSSFTDYGYSFCFFD